jgi:16S rRNA (guanine527-N7)-methyltransferase
LSDAAGARRALDLLLDTDAPALRASLPPGFADAAERYVELLLEANVRLNLTRIVDPAEVARLHLLDALSALPLLDALAAARALDLGSGGGVPGLVLALARPDVSWTLVDSAGKKADALRGFVKALGLGNVAVVAERAETLGRDAAYRSQFDLVAARACAPLPVLAEYALPLVRLGGALVAWKGVIDASELRAGRDAGSDLGGGALELHATGIPALGTHQFVLIRKVGPTPERFPRRPGQPVKRPLG